MVYKLNGAILPLDVPFTDSNGSSYPSNWLRFSSQEQRDGVPTGGITWVDDPPWYDKRFYTEHNVPKDIDKLKADWIEDKKDIAKTILAPTDWYVTRKSESGTAVPSDTATFRASVRTRCKEREDQITACSDTDALASLVNQPRFISGTASNGATEKKRANGDSYDPKQYEDILNPDILKDWPKE